MLSVLRPVRDYSKTRGKLYMPSAPTRGRGGMLPVSVSGATMTEIDLDNVEEQAEEMQEMYRKRYLATQLRQRLGREDSIQSLDMDVLSRVLAVFEEAEIDLSEEE